MAVHPSTRTRCARIATAAVLFAGGCGTGVVERLLPAAARTTPGEDAQAEGGEGVNHVLVAPASRGSSTEFDASPRPVRVYLVGPSSYLATNQPNPPGRLLAERTLEEMEKPTERRSSRERLQGREGSPEMN